MTTLHSGTVCGSSTIVRRLGSGEVADVYEAVAADGSRRAIKIIREQLPLDAKVQSRIAQEAEALAMIEHVNVVRFHAAGVHEGRVWIEMEIVDGADLRRVMGAAGGRLPIERAVGLVRQACEGVDAAHRQKIIHRDLKPENILVGRGDLVKVSDFGNARMHQWGVKTTISQEVESAMYMAPDLMLPGPRTVAADVYSMGLILYEAIAGENPIAPVPETLAWICTRQLHYTPRALHEVRTDVPVDLSLLLQRAMAKDPLRRCSMRELAGELESVQLRLLVWRREAARSIPLPNRERGHAATERMPARSEPASSVPPSSVLGSGECEGSAGGMSDAGGGAARREEDREAMLPPAGEAVAAEDDREALPPPPPAPTSLAAATLRTPSRPAAARTLPLPSVRAPGPAASLSAPPPLVTPELTPALTPAERPSTAVPVESTAVPPRHGSRALRVAGMCGVVAALGAAMGWTLLGRETGRPIVAAQPTATVTVATATASAAGASSSSKVPAPSASATAAPPKATARRPPAPTPVHRGPATR